MQKSPFKYTPLQNICLYVGDGLLSLAVIVLNGFFLLQVADSTSLDSSTSFNQALATTVAVIVLLGGTGGVLKLFMRFGWSKQIRSYTAGFSAFRVFAFSAVGKILIWPALIQVVFLSLYAYLLVA
ncbi:MAG TPA: hypothetical protein VFK03_03745 [Candidatus Saccharimonadales bacterium]|nr:hypothetical protein [Candidatus Saccharimonadales bacterium]